MLNHVCEGKFVNILSVCKDRQIYAEREERTAIYWLTYLRYSWGWAWPNLEAENPVQVSPHVSDWVPVTWTTAAASQDLQ